MAGNTKAPWRLSMIIAAMAAAFFMNSGTALADGNEPPPTPAQVQKAKGVTQVIPLGGGATSLELRKGYAFLPASDIPAILQKFGVAAPSGTILGGVTATGAKPGAKDYWLSVITTDSIGHVPETGADEIGSVEFFDSVKAARPAAPPLEAFATAPKYDKATKHLVWAEQYQDKANPNLRFEQRVLGRDGVTGVTTIGQSSALKKVAKAAGDVLSMLTFGPGASYADYNAGTDAKSEYDLPGLITGKRKAGPLAETASAGAPPASGPAFSLANFAPGGKYQLASYLLGGIVLLTGGYFVVSALRGRGSDDANLTPHDDDGNAV